MKTLTFADNTSIQVADNSTISEIMIVVGSYAEVDSLAPRFTTANMVKVVLGDETFHNIIPTSVTVSGDENIISRFFTRTQTTEEIIANQAQQITELQEVVAELINGDEEV